MTKITVTGGVRGEENGKQEIMQGFFTASYSYSEEGGDSSPSEIKMCIEQLLDVVRHDDQNIYIKFNGSIEHSGFVDLCKEVVKEFGMGGEEHEIDGVILIQCPVCGQYKVK